MSLSYHLDEIRKAGEAMKADVAALKDIHTLTGELLELFGEGRPVLPQDVADRGGTGADGEGRGKPGADERVEAVATPKLTILPPQGKGRGTGRVPCRVCGSRGRHTNACRDSKRALDEFKAEVEEGEETVTGTAVVPAPFVPAPPPIRPRLAPKPAEEEHTSHCHGAVIMGAPGGGFTCFRCGNPVNKTGGEVREPGDRIEREYKCIREDCEDYSKPFTSFNEIGVALCHACGQTKLVQVG